MRNTIRQKQPAVKPADTTAIPSSWSEEVETSAIGVMSSSYRPILGALGVFLAWAIFVPLDSAVIAPGTLISEGRNQVVQHQSGGLIQKIHKKEGESVKAGEVIVSLDPLVDQASLTRLEAQHARLTALQSRLEAEKTTGILADNATFASITLRGIDPIITASTKPHSSMAPDEALRLRLNNEQLREFEQGRIAIRSSVASIEKQTQNMRYQKKALEKRINHITRQRDLMRQQYKSAQRLNNQGFIASQQVWQLESQLLQLETQVSAAKTELLTLNTSIAESRDQIEEIRANDARQTSQQLTEIFAQLREVSDSLEAAKATRELTEIRAPTSGTIVRMTTNTVGAVLPASQTIAEVVPETGEYMVEGKVALTDITSVYKGQPAEVQISALNGRLYDPVPAIVTHVEADSTLDERTGERYFNVLARMGPEIPMDVRSQLSVGMSGDIFMKGERRTFAAYLLKPFTESLGRSFKEPK